MNTNINISSINNHFFPTLDEPGALTSSRPYKSTLVNYDFYSVNEIQICDNIKQIRYYSNNFYIIEDYGLVDIGQLSEKVVEQLHPTDETKYMIFKYNNENLVDFDTFLFNMMEPKRFLFNTIMSFSYLLDSLRLLHENDICFFNLSPQNIAFNLDCGEKPVIRNFQTSLLVSRLNVEYITQIIQKQQEYTHKPLEVHVLFYIIQNNLSTISYAFIEEVCDTFLEKLPFLCLFSKNFTVSYKDACVASLKKYINQPRSDIILDILKNSDKWDVYSLSMLYLHIFGGISRVFSLQPTFITKFMTELSKNIHPVPTKRSSLDELFAAYTMLLTEEPDWTFVDQFSRDKMPQLFAVLGE